MLVNFTAAPGLLSLVYPIAVFGYAMIEETRPSKTFWRSMLYYSFVMLFVKYVVNLETF
jgi:hypothetical protein